MQGKLPRLTAAIFRRGGRAERNLRAVDAPLHQPNAEAASLSRPGCRINTRPSPYAPAAAHAVISRTARTVVGGFSLAESPLRQQPATQIDQVLGSHRRPVCAATRHVSRT